MQFPAPSLSEPWEGPGRDLAIYILLEQGWGGVPTYPPKAELNNLTH